MPSFVFLEFFIRYYEEVIFMKPYIDTAIRLTCGKTQQDLANEACLGVNTIWRYENGDHVRGSTYNKIQAALYRFSRDYMTKNSMGPGEFYTMANLVLIEIDGCYKWVRPKNH